MVDARPCNRDLDRFGLPLRRAPKHPADWVPAVDIVEEKDRFLLRADLPGVDRSDIDVSMEDGVLTIAGERHTREAESEQVCAALSASAAASIAVSPAGDRGRRGHYREKRNGILEVSIPKQPECSRDALRSKRPDAINNRCPIATLCCDRASLL